MRPRLPLFAVCLLVCLSALQPVFAAQCTLTPVAIQPVGAEPAEQYVGSAQGVEFRFHNDKRELPVSVFPEPPLEVVHSSTRQACEIKQGGVWVREHVYVNRDASVLVTHEYSGSNDALNFYNTQTCQRVASLDVSGARWAIQPGAIVVRRLTGNWAVRHLKLNSACLPSGR
ncbi:hypothetical protein [Limnobacter humi]|uniref:hypothetical protein n=1 Tax=Limnobacter humi TaxID=1778671 RepID=UPI00351C402E